VAEQQRHETAGGQQRARGPQLRVARDPLGVVSLGLRLPAFEVDTDGAPVANEVVEQEPGRPVVLVAVVEVPAEDALPAVLMGVAADLAGL
jgi:hypothetical protein